MSGCFGAQGWGEASGDPSGQLHTVPTGPLPSPVTNGTSSAQVRGWEQTGWARGPQGHSQNPS